MERGIGLLPRLLGWVERVSAPGERNNGARQPEASARTASGFVLDAKIASLVEQIPASSPEELQRKLELLAKAGPLAEVERKLGLLSAFDAYLVKMLRQIPAETHHELEEKIALLIPENERATALAQAKEGAWRGYNSFLVDLARRIPAGSPSELEEKIAGLIKTIEQNCSSSNQRRSAANRFAWPRVKPVEAAPTFSMPMMDGRAGEGQLAAPATGLAGGFRKILGLLGRPTGIDSARVRAQPRMPEAYQGRPETGLAPKKSERDTAFAEPFAGGDIAALPDEPFRSQPAHLRMFGPRCELFDKIQVAAASRGMIGPGVDLSFPPFVQWLQSEQYAFCGFDDEPPRFDQRRAYLRYDVHPADLLPAYVLAELHERLGIIGSFQITWKLSRDEEDAEPYFLKLLEFDRQFVQFGLHAAPVATWYLYEKLGIDAAFEGVADGEDFAAWMLDLHAAYLRDGDDAPALRELREGTDDTFSRIAASFRAAFGDWKSVSAHGNVLTKGYVKLRRQYPQLQALQHYFYPEDYFAKWGLERFGFHYETTSFGEDSLPYPRVLYEASPEEMRRTWYRGRVAHGAGFVALLHPATWTCKQNATFFLPEDQVRSAPGSGVSHPTAA